MEVGAALKREAWVTGVLLKGPDTSTVLEKFRRRGGEGAGVGDCAVWRVYV